MNADKLIKMSWVETAVKSMSLYSESTNSVNWETSIQISLKALSHFLIKQKIVIHSK